MRKKFLSLPTGLLIVLTLCFSIAYSPIDANDWFEVPVQLKANGVVIDTGASWGHCGPTMSDIDGDGLNDLVVGDFSGKFQFFKNTDSNESPKFAEGKFLTDTNGNPLTVPIY